MIDWSPNLRKSCILLCVFNTHEIEAFVESYMTASLGVCLSIATTWEEFFCSSGHIPCHCALIGRFWLTAMFLLVWCVQTLNLLENYILQQNEKWWMVATIFSNMAANKLQSFVAFFHKRNLCWIIIFHCFMILAASATNSAFWGCNICCIYEICRWWTVWSLWTRWVCHVELTNCLWTFLFSSDVGWTFNFWYVLCRPPLGGTGVPPGASGPQQKNEKSGKKSGEKSGVKKISTFPKFSRLFPQLGRQQDVNVRFWPLNR